MEIRGYAFQALADPSGRANIASIALQAITPKAIGMMTVTGTVQCII